MPLRDPSPAPPIQGVGPSAYPVVFNDAADWDGNVYLAGEWHTNASGTEGDAHATEVDGDSPAPRLLRRHAAIGVSASLPHTAHES